MGGRLSRTRFESLRDHFAAFDQQHVFRFWEHLGAAERERLLAQAIRLDLPALLRARDEGLKRMEAAPHALEPVEVERAVGHGGDPERAREARARGQAMLAEGRVAALVVAGGQGTRLGLDGPKGAFRIGPVSGRTLFEIQAQKLHRVRRQSGRPLPWYVMTSPATDAATRAFFSRAGNFGLPAEDVIFFTQGTVPSFDFEGRLILERPDRIFENPDGHGGSLTALLASGALDDMERRGVDTIFYYQVDNPLARIADPVYLGLHALAGAQMSCKVVRKQQPMEKMGVVARSDGRVGVVEYTELDDAHRHARDANGELVYWTGNMAIHVFETSFVRRVASEAERWLPFHASAKKIPCVDAEGRPLEPAEPNGHKLERFVFDALPAAERVCVVEALREAEYAPVKNAEGGDSPATARRALVANYRAWLEAAGIEVPAGAVLEVDHSRIDGPQDARDLGLRNLAEAADILRIAPGAGP